MENNLKVFDANTALANFDAFEKMSKTFVESGAFPKDMNAPKFVVLMQAGYDLGLAPTEAIRSLAVINGNVSMFGTKVIERVRSNGYKIELDEELKEEIYEKDKKKYKRFVGHCTATLTKMNTIDRNTVAGQEEKWTETYTMEDAKVAGLVGKDNWTKYPKLMLRYRAIGQCVKFFCPEVLGGVSMYEEMKDHFGDDRAFETVTDAEILDGFETKLDTEDTPVLEVENVVEKPEKPVDKQVASESKSSVKKEVKTEKEEPKEYKPGARVRHKLLKEGTIDDIFMNKSLVKFDSGTLKEIDNKMLELI